MYIYIHIHTYIYIYTHIYIHICIYPRICRASPELLNSSPRAVFPAVSQAILSRYFISEPRTTHSILEQTLFSEKSVDHATICLYNGKSSFSGAFGRWWCTQLQPTANKKASQAPKPPWIWQTRAAAFVEAHSLQMHYPPKESVEGGKEVLQRSVEGGHRWARVGYFMVSLQMGESGLLYG